MFRVEFAYQVEHKITPLPSASLQATLFQLVESKMDKSRKNQKNSLHSFKNFLPRVFQIYQESWQDWTLTAPIADALQLNFLFIFLTFIISVM